MASPLHETEDAVRGRAGVPYTRPYPTSPASFLLALFGCGGSSDGHSARHVASGVIPRRGQAARLAKTGIATGEEHAMAETSAASPMQVSSAAQTRRIRQVAYDLWCLQDDRQRGARPLGSLEALMAEFRQRHPTLAGELLEQGVDLFLQGQIEAHYQRLIQQRRQLFFLTVPKPLTWPRPPTSQGPQVIPSPTVDACTLLKRTGYNGHDACATGLSSWHSPQQNRGYCTDPKTAPP